MTVGHEDDWQRDTEHPSTRALLTFLEADVRRGIILIAAAADACKDGRTIPANLATELESVQAEVGRWLNRARARRIPLGSLSQSVIEFLAAVDAVGGVSRTTVQ